MAVATPLSNDWKQHWPLGDVPHRYCGVAETDQIADLFGQAATRSPRRNRRLLTAGDEPSQDHGQAKAKGDACGNRAPGQ